MKKAPKEKQIENNMEDIPGIKEMLERLQEGTRQTVPYIPSLPFIQPCPTCGTCPTCGRQGNMFPIQPVYVGDFPTFGGTAIC